MNKVSMTRMQIALSNTLQHLQYLKKSVKEYEKAKKNNDCVYASEYTQHKLDLITEDVETELRSFNNFLKDIASVKVDPFI